MGADIAVDIGVVSDPGSGRLLSFGILNFGPDDATNVTFRVATPEGTTLGSVSVDQACRITTPGDGNAGEIVVEFERIAAGLNAIVDLRLGVPNQPGWVSETTGVATADQSDPDTTNNALTLAASVPVPPVIERVRVLENPFRLEITGSGLNLNPFGSVIVGCYDEYFAPVVENTDSRIVVGGGRELRKRLPASGTVPITVTTPNGATVTIPFTRRPS